MQTHACSIEMQAGEHSPRRGVAFLKSSTVSYVNVTTTFPTLDENTQRTFNTRMDTWVTGAFDNKPAWYHGWDKSQYGGAYVDCFVVKARDDRLYGFLCHPKKPLDPRYLLCVLILHANKTDWSTDVTELKRAKAMSTDSNVAQALTRLFSKK
jgi:hypothetical protein